MNLRGAAGGAAPRQAGRMPAGRRSPTRRAKAVTPTWPATATAGDRAGKSHRRAGRAARAAGSASWSRRYEEMQGAAPIVYSSLTGLRARQPVRAASA